MRVRRLPVICGALLFTLGACEEPTNGSKAGDVGSTTADTTADAGNPSDITTDTNGVDAADSGSLDPTLGGPCESSGARVCDANGEVLHCAPTNGVYTWKPFPNHEDSEQCFCSGKGPEAKVSCAVPGFVGLDRTGRQRKAPTLRARRRASSQDDTTSRLCA